MEGKALSSLTTDPRQPGKGNHQIVEGFRSHVPPCQIRCGLPTILDNFPVEGIQNRTHGGIHVVSGRCALGSLRWRGGPFTHGRGCLVRWLMCATATAAFVRLVDGALHVQLRAGHRFDGTADRFVRLGNLSHTESGGCGEQQDQLVVAKAHISDVLEKVSSGWLSLSDLSDDPWPLRPEQIYIDRPRYERRSRLCGLCRS